MQRIKRLFDFYINSSTHVSLSVVALGWITYLSLDINVNFVVLSFLFFSTVTGYNFVKYAESFGATGYQPKSVKEFTTNLDEALTAKGVQVIDLAVDYSLNHEILNVILKEFSKNIK